MKTASFFAAAALAVASVVQAASPALVLSEWNCVGADKYLGDTSSASTFYDPAFLPKAKGNAGNWVELKVVQDNLDIRGWVLEWENADPDDGLVEFSSHIDLSSIPQGTVITIMEAAVDSGENINQYGWQLGSVIDDGHYHLLVSDEDYLEHTNGFKVDNDLWKMRILRPDGLGGYIVVQDYQGEDVGGYTGSSLSSTEVGWLTVDPIAVDITTGSYYEDNAVGSFGQ